MVAESRIRTVRIYLLMVWVFKGVEGGGGVLIRDGNEDLGKQFINLILSTLTNHRKTPAMNIHIVNS